MKVGEKRKVVIPYQLAYGEQGAPPDIPGKTALVFTLERKS
jgi:FKBP-type peptidyl-prolyl cis-trans isomerase